MDLRAVASKPVLQKVTLDNPQFLETFGEPLEFFMYDRQSMDTYIRLSTINQTDVGAMIKEVRKLLFDAQGKPMLDEDQELPIDVLIETINAVVARLGNLESQTSKTLTKTQS